MSCKTILPCRSVGGVIRVPGDKSISHRAIMLGALAEGDSVIHNFLDSADCRATVDIFKMLGGSIVQKGAYRDCMNPKIFCRRAIQVLQPGLCWGFWQDWICLRL